MKRKRDLEAYQRFQRKRAKAALAATRRRRVYLRRKRTLQPQQLAISAPSAPPQAQAQTRQNVTTVHAPSVLSIIGNAEETIEFFTELHGLFQKRRRVWVSLGDVTQISYDGIVALLAAMIRFKAAGIGFNG